MGIGVVAWFYVAGEGGSSLQGAHSGNLEVINFQTLKPASDGYLVCAPKACAEGAASASAKIYAVNRSRLSQALFAYTDNNANIQTFRQDLGAWQFDFTERLVGEKFPHVITVQFISLSPNESSLNIYSRSELKSSDATLHRERIERWFRFIESSLSR